MTKPPVHEVYAIRYATHDRQRSANFMTIDEHDVGPMPLDFFVWLVRSPQSTVLVDTGFNADMAARRHRHLLRCPIEALRVLAVEPETVDDVILTHLHYDHAGNLSKLPRARFHVQDDEVAYATGRCMCFEPLRRAYAVEDMIELMRKLYSDRLVFHDGDGQFAPGIELIRIGGHTRGLQAVRVWTARGWIVLASDASHFYENMERDRPFPIVYNVADMLAGYRKLAAAADSPRHIIPGHDPQVLARYPGYGDDRIGIACVHEAPRVQ